MDRFPRDPFTDLGQLDSQTLRDIAETAAQGPGALVGGGCHLALGPGGSVVVPAGLDLPFPVRLTSSCAVSETNAVGLTYLYGWIEQYLDPVTELYQDLPGGRQGFVLDAAGNPLDQPISPAYEFYRRQVPICTFKQSGQEQYPTIPFNTPVIVFLTRLPDVLDGQPVYSFTWVPAGPNVKYVTGDYTVLISDDGFLLDVDCSAGNVTVTLPYGAVGAGGGGSALPVVNAGFKLGVRRFDNTPGTYLFVVSHEPIDGTWGTVVALTLTGYFHSAWVMNTQENGWTLLSRTMPYTFVGDICYMGPAHDVEYLPLGNRVFDNYPGNTVFGVLACDPVTQAPIWATGSHVSFDSNYHLSALELSPTNPSLPVSLALPSPSALGAEFQFKTCVLAGSDPSYPVTITVGGTGAYRFLCSPTSYFIDWKIQSGGPLFYVPMGQSMPINPAMGDLLFGWNRTWLGAGAPSHGWQTLAIDQRAGYVLTVQREAGLDGILYYPVWAPLPGTAGDTGQYGG